MRRIFAALIVLLMSTCLQAATIHVNNLAGKDTANSTTPQAAVATFQHAVTLLAAGDTLDIANTGKPYCERLLITREIGTPSQPLIIEGNGAVLSGLLPLDQSKWSRQADGVYVYAVPPMARNLKQVLMMGDQEVPAVDKPEELKSGFCCWQPEKVLFMPENEGILKTGNLQATLIDSGVALQNTSYVTIRNIISERHTNDGFNFHGNVRGIQLENVIGRYNGDDGCSIHEDGQLTVRNSWFHHNTYGIEDINASNSTYQNVLCEDNEVGVHFSGGMHQITDSTFRNNSTHQVRISSGKPSNYLGKDRAAFMYDNLCVARNVQVYGGKTGVLTFNRARLFMINSIITGSQIGILQLKGSSLELRNSVLADCTESLAKLEEATWLGDANIIGSGRLVHDNKALDFPTWQQVTGSDANSLQQQPVFASGTPMLSQQPIAGITVGLTAVYDNPMTPTVTVTEDDGTMLQRLIDQAIKNNAKTLKIPAGTYRIHQTLNVHNARDMNIDATGVNLIMTRWEPVLDFHKCGGIVFSGVTVDYDPLPFTQGVVTKVQPDGAVFEMKLDAGYPSVDQMGKRVHLHLFDPATGYWKAKVWDMYPQSIDKQDDGTLQIAPSKPEPNLLAGDKVVIGTRASRAMNVTRASGKNTFKDITFHTAPGLVICGRECDDVQTFDHVVIDRGPKPAGATANRLLSSTADGVNFAYCRVGPVLENCDFAWMGDDSLNVHGALLPVVATPDAHTVIVARLSGNDILPRVILPGDTMRIMARDTFAMEQHARVLKVETYKQPLELDFDKMQKEFFTSTLSRAKSRNYTLFEVTLEQEHHAKAWEQVIDFPTFNCVGYVVRNNYFHDHRARGLRLMGNDGLVEGNTFERIGQSAISIGAEMGYWAEAGWVENVIIRNNTIRDVNRDRNATANSALVLGAIGTFVHTNVKTQPYLGHRGIVIQNNTIDGSGTAGIHIYAADDVTITGNTIRNANTQDSITTGIDWGQSVKGPLEVHGAMRKTLSDNKIH